uniref:TIR domain-containing protein n=1 Tax=Macrostomum lignano TaxID=282301 RepID=A0A1I8FG02_9PLAT
MLSQRVILVLSGQFVTHSWPELEDALQHACRPPASGSEKSFPSPWATPSSCPISSSR